MKEKPIKKEAAVKKYTMAEKWDRICKIANADMDANPAEYPSDEELEKMAKIRGCSVMDLIYEQTKRDIALGRPGYPMPLDDD